MVGPSLGTGLILGAVMMLLISLGLAKAVTGACSKTLRGAINKGIWFAFYVSLAVSGLLSINVNDSPVFWAIWEPLVIGLAIILGLSFFKRVEASKCRENEAPKPSADTPDFPIYVRRPQDKSTD
jgi:hypothetical protein